MYQVIIPNLGFDNHGASYVIASEKSLHKALALWGMGFFLRPLSLVLIALIALTVGWAVYRARRSYTVASHAA